MKTICGCDLKKDWRMVRKNSDGRGLYVATCAHGLAWTSVTWESEYVIWNEMERPTIVCLCGSTRFFTAFQVAGLEETLRGNIVLSIGAASGTDDEHFGDLPREEYDRIKAKLDILHFHKIYLCDRVLILNVGGYIGESTQRELDYARALGKEIRYLEEP